MKNIVFGVLKDDMEEAKKVAEGSILLTAKLDESFKGALKNVKGIILEDSSDIRELFVCNK